jgi:hypothetical protein
MAELQKYFISDADFKKYYFRSTAGLYGSLGSPVTGIYAAAENEQDAPEFLVKDLLKKGLLVRLSVVVDYASKRGTLRLLCNRLSLTTIMSAAINKTFTITNGKTGTIKSINQKLKVVSRG